MRILQIFNRYVEKGGEEASVRRIFGALDERHEIRQLSFASEEWLAESWYLKVLQPLRMFYSPASVRTIREQVREFQPDVALVHNLFPVGSLAAYACLMDLGIPVVQYVHNFRPFSVNGYCWAEGRLQDGGLKGNFWPEIRGASWQNSRLKTAVYATVIKLGHALGVWEQIDRWVAISRFMEATFVEAGIEADKISTLRHSWGIVNEDPPELTEDADSLLFLGRLTEEKGLETLLDAWALLEQRRDGGWLVIGGSGPLESYVKERVKGLKRVRFEGFVQGEKKRTLLRDCQAMVVPSVWWEPLGLVVYEAYDYGRPVLAAASGGLTETVTEGETGWLHPPGNAPVLAHQMDQALSSSAEARRRGLAGREWLEKNTGVDHWIQELEEVFEDMKGRRIE